MFIKNKPILKDLKNSKLDTHTIYVLTTQLKDSDMKKNFLAISIATIMLSTTGFATDFNLTIDNQSDADGLQLFSSTDQGNTKDLESGKNSFNLSTENQYQIRIPNKQIMASIKQDNSYFDVQGTPQDAAPGIQNLKVEIDTSNGSSGSYQTVNPANQDGFCQPDTGSSITCELGQSVPNSITITLTGGEKPQPVAEYTYDAGDWDSSQIYQPKNNPVLYPKVTYNGEDYVGCWYATGDNVPGQGDPWREYDPMKNVCS